MKCLFKKLKCDITIQTVQHHTNPHAYKGEKNKQKEQPKQFYHQNVTKICDWY